MPEALEKWPVAVLGKLLPRHLEIIDKIDSIWKDSLKVYHTCSAYTLLKRQCPLSVIFALLLSLQSKVRLQE